VVGGPLGQRLEEVPEAGEGAPVERVVTAWRTRTLLNSDRWVFSAK